MSEVFGPGAIRPLGPGFRVLHLSAGHDTGGQGYRLAVASRRHAEWDARAVRSSPNYINYPSDLIWDKRTIGAVYAAADLIHVHNLTSPLVHLDRDHRKPIVIHHHGTRFRTHWRDILPEQRRYGFVPLVSTIDLLLCDEYAEWLPSPFNLAELAALRRKEFRSGGTFRIAHAPTNREVKGTAVFLRAIERLARRHRIEVDVIEHAPWDECLRRKAAADLFYDQCDLGYGNNAIECWAMGIPVIAGASDPAILARMRAIIGPDLPFIETDEAAMEATLDAAITDAELRREYARRGRSYVTRFHDEPRVVDRLRGIYARALESRTPHRIVPRGSRGMGTRSLLVRVQIRPGMWVKLTPEQARAYQPPPPPEPDPEPAPEPVPAPVADVVKPPRRRRAKAVEGEVKPPRTRRRKVAAA